MIKMIKQHDKRLADAWRELFANDSWGPFTDNDFGDQCCVFCGGVDHTEDCIYMRVEAILLMEGTIKNEVD